MPSTTTATKPTTTLPVPPITSPATPTPAATTTNTISSSSSSASHPPPILILIAGAPCSGKKTVLTALKSKLHQLSKLQNIHLTTSTLHLRDFHVALTEEEVVSGGVGKVGGGRDMECLQEFELGLLREVVEGLGTVGGGVGGVRAPRWEEGGGRGWGVVEVEGEEGASAVEKVGSGRPVVPDVVLVEGMYLLCDKELLERASVKIFVECDPDVRLARRVLRDSTHTPTTAATTTSPPTKLLSLDYIFDQHIRFSKPSSEIVIQPTKVLADIILPRGAEGPGVELIANGVVDDLRDGRGRGKVTGHHGVGVEKEKGAQNVTLLEGPTGAGAYYEMV